MLPMGYVATIENHQLENALRAAVRGYTRRFKVPPTVLYVRPGTAAPESVDGVPVRGNSSVGLLQVYATVEP